MNPIYQQDKIDNFLLDRLNTIDKEMFIKELEQDPQLREAVELQKDVINQLIERERIKEIMDKIDNKRKLSISLINVLKIAAIFIGIVGLMIWQPTKLSNEALFKENNFILTSKFEESDFRTNELERGRGSSFKNLNVAERLKIQEAFKYYKSGNFAKADSLFSSVLDPLEKDYDIAIYLGISQLNSGKYKNANRTFLSLVMVKGYKHLATANYYLALSYLKLNKLHDAKRILRQIVKDGGDYAEKAKQILGEMRFF